MGADEQKLIQLSAYLDGELPSAERAAIEAELAADAGLRRQFDILKKLHREAAALPVPEVGQWKGISSRTTDRDRAFDAKLNRAAAQIAIPRVSEECLKSVWENIARRTVRAEEIDQDAIRASAAYDGEGHGPVAEAKQRFWKPLDETARTLPVPRPAEVAWAECFHGISRRTAASPAIGKIEAHAAAMAVPQMSDQAAARAWKNIASRTVACDTDTPRLDGTAEVPQVSNQKWDNVWSGIEKRITQPAEAAKPAHNVVQAEAQFTQVRKRRWHVWRWVSGGVLAAGLFAAVLISRMQPVVKPPESTQVAMVVPEPLDNRYMVSVSYVDSQPEPVVCFFLKKDAEDDDRDDGPYWFSNIK